MSNGTLVLCTYGRVYARVYVRTLIRHNQLKLVSSI